MIFMPQSMYKVLNDDFIQIWQEFNLNLRNLRQQNEKFNSLYVCQKDQVRYLSGKKEELYQNLFLVVSITQVQMRNSIKNFMDTHRARTIQQKQGIFFLGSSFLTSLSSKAKRWRFLEAVKTWSNFSLFNSLSFSMKSITASSSALRSSKSKETLWTQKVHTPWSEIFQKRSKFWRTNSTNLFGCQSKRKGESWFWEKAPSS